MKDKNINILETFFELIQLEVATMQQKIISRHWSFWKIIEKEPQKPRPKLKKKNYREYLFCLQSNASGSFSQACINFYRTKTQILSL